MKRGFLIVLSDPSGCGKGTVADELFRRNDDIVFSVSATTREARPGEVDGKSYFFLSEEEFLKKVENEEFLEYASVHGHYYGTPKDFITQKKEDEGSSLHISSTAIDVGAKEKTSWQSN